MKGQSSVNKVFQILTNLLSMGVIWQWYFVSKIVPTYCEKTIVLFIETIFLKFEAKGQVFAKNLRSLEQFIQTVKGQNNFW